MRHVDAHRHRHLLLLLRGGAEAGQRLVLHLLLRQVLEDGAALVAGGAVLQTVVKDDAGDGRKLC